MITTKPLLCILGSHNYEHIFCKKVGEGVDGEPIEVVRHTLRCKRKGCRHRRTQTTINYHEEN